ncbi:hypothetical protein CS542_09100 [Pedobacter sp. IW39]|nr:hypothetical protein CS542_09100 [Pedobacter sp. IW39]
MSRAKRAGYQPKDLLYTRLLPGYLNYYRKRTPCFLRGRGLLSGASGLPIQQWYFELETPSVSHTLISTYF